MKRLWLKEKGFNELQASTNIKGHFSPWMHKNTLETDKQDDQDE
jgi:hypothetical protein